MNERPRLEQVDADKISLWKDVNVRTVNVEGDLEDLVGNIKQNGLQYPLLVKRDRDSYRVFSGQRRFLACVKAGLASIPCFVYDDIGIDRARVLSLSENLYRRAMEHTDKVRACQMLLSSHDGDKQAVAAALGVSIQTVRNYLGFAALPDEVKEMVGENDISVSQATSIFGGIKDEETAKGVARELASIPKTERKERRSLVSAAEDAGPTDSVADIRKRASTIRNAVEYNLMLPAKYSDIVERAAADYQSSKEEIALEFLVDRIRLYDRGVWDR